MPLIRHHCLQKERNVCFGRKLLKPRYGQNQLCSSSFDSKRHKKRKLLDVTKSHNLAAYKLELNDAQLEKWLVKTGRFSKKKMWKIEEKRVLKDWFDLIDRDKSGEIDIEELADPLMSAGITKTMSEVKDIVRRIDEDGSSSIDFSEFLKMMKDDKSDFPVVSRDVKKYRSTINRKNNKSPSDINPMIQLTKTRQDDLLNFHSILSHSRRKILLDATMEQCCRREMAHEQITAWRDEMKRLKGVKKLRKGLDISVLIQRIETESSEKENFIKVMENFLQSKTNDNVQQIDAPDRKNLKNKSRSNISILSHVSGRNPHNGLSRQALLHPRVPSIHRVVGIRRSNPDTVITCENK